MKDYVRLFIILFDFLDSLSENELEELYNNKSKLKLEKAKEINNEQYQGIPVDDICNKLDSLTSVDEAKQYLVDLHLLKHDLRNIAKHYDVPYVSKESNSNLVTKIVENVVGSKLRFNTLLSTDLRG